VIYPRAVVSSSSWESDLIPRKRKRDLEALEERIRKAEILLDSGTQKALRGLAYLRAVREMLTDLVGSHQMTLTFTPGEGKSPKKRWVLKPPKEVKHPNPEHRMWARCWFCDRVFQKTMECPTCSLYVCPHCGRCGCHLTPEALKAVRYTLDTVFGRILPDERIFTSVRRENP